MMQLRRRLTMRNFETKLHIICTHGASRSGKDTALNFIRKHLWRHTITTAHIDFADPLRTVTSELLGCTPRELHDSEFRATPQELLGGKTPVDFMRLLGTEFARDMISPDFWRTIWARRLYGWAMNKQDMNKDLVVLVSDARFIDEIESIYATHVSYDVAIHHLCIHNEKATWSNHASDKMNKLWMVNLITPNGAVANAINLGKVTYFDNSYTLDDYNVLLAEWTEKFILTLQA